MAVLINVDRIGRELRKEANMCILQHINIVALLAIIMELGHYGLVMECVLYGPLDDFILTHCVMTLIGLY